MIIEAKTFPRNSEEVFIEGLAVGNQIYIPPLNPQKFFVNVWHEVGHFLAHNLSFLNGDVLTPDEVKQTTIPLSLTQQISLCIDLLYDKKANADKNEKLWPIAYRVLQKFTKNKIDDLDFEVFTNVTQEQFTKFMTKNPDNTTFGVNSDGNLRIIANKLGRDKELPANVVEAGCFKILTNSLPFISLDLGRNNLFNTSYFRALNVVKRAYRYPGYNLPSYVDMENMARLKK